MIKAAGVRPGGGLMAGGAAGSHGALVQPIGVAGAAGVRAGDRAMRGFDLGKGLAVAALAWRLSVDPAQREAVHLGERGHRGARLAGGLARRAAHREGIAAMIKAGPAVDVMALVAVSIRLDMWGPHRKVAAATLTPLTRDAARWPLPMTGVTCELCMTTVQRDRVIRRRPGEQERRQQDKDPHRHAQLTWTKPAVCSAMRS